MRRRRGHSARAGSDPKLSRGAHAAGSLADMAPSDLITELLKIERAGWDSPCNGTGGEFYGTLMTEGAVMILANGVALDRDAVVSSLRDAPPWQRYEISSEKLIGGSADFAILVYRGHAYGEGMDSPFVAWMSSAYVRSDGAWRLAAYQQTPLASADR